MNWKKLYDKRSSRLQKQSEKLRLRSRRTGPTPQSDLSIWVTIAFVLLVAYILV